MDLRRDAIALALSGRGFAWHELEPELVQFGLDSDLGPWWHHTLAEVGQEFRLGRRRPEFETRRAAAAARYIAQRVTVDRLHHVLERADVPYAVMKGVALRERLLSDPSVMQAADIDVLVHPGDRDAAVRALCAEGFELDPQSRNASHEVTLRSAHVDVDLHWHILRPGRLKHDPVAEMLARRERVGGFWSLGDADGLFVALAHPAFAKHVCSVEMGLPRVLAFLLLSERCQPHWQRVLDLLRQTGVATAAWTMLVWYESLAPDDRRDAIQRWQLEVEPGPVRRAYLRAWMNNVAGSREASRWAVPVGMLPFLHDRFSDSVRAHLELLAERCAARAQLAAVQSAAGAQ